MGGGVKKVVIGTEELIKSDYIKSDYIKSDYIK